MDKASPRKQAGERIWANEALRHHVAEQCTDVTLAKLACVSRTGFRAAVPFLWGWQGSVMALKDRLARVKNTSRHLAYSKAVRHIDIELAAMDQATLGPLIISYPSLQSVNTEYMRSRWSLVSDGDTVKVTVDTTANVLDDSWDASAARLRTYFPDDWEVKFACRSVVVKTEAEATKLRERVEKDGIAIIDLTIHALDKTTYFDLLAFLAKSSIRVDTITPYMRFQNAGGGSWAASQEEAQELIRHSRRIAEGVKMEGMWHKARVVHGWRKMIRSFRRVSCKIDFWSQGVSDFDGMPFKPLMDGSTTAAGPFQLRQFQCLVSYKPKTLGVQTDREALQVIHDNSTWIRSLARLLLLIGGPTVRYSLVLANNDRRATVSTAHDMQRAQRDSETYTRRMNDIIATYIECRSAARPAGWHRISPQKGLPELVARKGANEVAADAAGGMRGRGGTRANSIKGRGRGYRRR